MNTPQIAVIGAGPAGLSTAYFLVRHGFAPTVFEAGTRIGGLAGAVQLWGRSWDLGPHIVLTGCQPEAVAFWEEIGGTDLARLPLSRGMLLNRRLIDFPPRLVGLLSALGPATLLQAGLSALAARCRAAPTPRDAGAFFHARYGEPFRQLVFQPFCEKYMGLRDRDVDVCFAEGLTSFSAAAPSGRACSDAAVRSLLYPRNGGTLGMWTRVAERLVSRGRIVFGKTLTRATTRGQHIERLHFADGSSVEPDVVVSTLPVGRLLQAIDGCPPEMRAQSARLASRSTVLVYLRVAGRSFAHQYLTAFDHSLDAGRITNFAQWTDPPSPADDSVLCLEYWCSRGDATWAADDAALIAKASRELELAGLCERERVRAGHVLRLSASHPVLSLNHQGALQAVNAYLARYDNLTLAGRHATFKWDGQTDNIIAGMRLAETISARYPCLRQPAARSA